MGVLAMEVLGQSSVIERFRWPLDELRSGDIAPIVCSWKRNGSAWLSIQSPSTSNVGHYAVQGVFQHNERPVAVIRQARLQTSNSDLWTAVYFRFDVVQLLTASELSSFIATNASALEDLQRTSESARQSAMVEAVEIIVQDLVEWNLQTGPTFHSLEFQTNYDIAGLQLTSGARLAVRDREKIGENYFLNLGANTEGIGETFEIVWSENADPVSHITLREPLEMHGPDGSTAMFVMKTSAGAHLEVPSPDGLLLVAQKMFDEAEAGLRFSTQTVERAVGVFL